MVPSRLLFPEANKNNMAWQTMCLDNVVNSLRHAFFVLNNGTNASNLTSTNVSALRDSFEYSPPIHFGSERETPTNVFNNASGKNINAFSVLIQ